MNHNYENCSTLRRHPHSQIRPVAHFLLMKSGLSEHSVFRRWITRPLKRWKASQQWTNDRGRFIPHSTTWLNREVCNDTILGGWCRGGLSRDLEASHRRQQQSDRDYQARIEAAQDERRREFGITSSRSPSMRGEVDQHLASHQTKPRSFEPIHAVITLLLLQAGDGYVFCLRMGGEEL